MPNTCPNDGVNPGEGAEEAMLRVSAKDLARLTKDNEDLRAQVKMLQQEGSRRIEHSLYRTVRAFHKRFSHPVRHTPAVPSADDVRFRLKLITEEYFELLEAAGLDGVGVEGEGEDCFDPHEMILADIAENIRTDEVNLPEFVDALADLDYVIEGTRAVFGVMGDAIAAEVHRANMSKDPNGPDGKPVKPEGWRPPDIAGVLAAQGWERP